MVADELRAVKSTKVPQSTVYVAVGVGWTLRRPHVKVCDLSMTSKLGQVPCRRQTYVFHSLSGLFFGKLSPRLFLDFILERKNRLCHTSLQKHSVFLISQEQRGFSCSRLGRKGAWGMAGRGLVERLQSCKVRGEAFRSSASVRAASCACHLRE